MKEIRVGDRSVFYAQTLLVRDNQAIDLSIPLQESAQIGAVPLNLQIVILNSKEAQPTSISWMELTRFGGHPNVSHGGVRDGVQEYPVHTGV